MVGEFEPLGKYPDMSVSNEMVVSEILENSS